MDSILTDFVKEAKAFKELKQLNVFEADDLRRIAYPWVSLGQPSEDQISAAMARYQAYRKQWSACRDSLLQTPFPTNVDIEISSTCNLRCKMCQWGFDPAENPDPQKFARFQEFKKNAGTMTTTFFKALVDEAASEGAYAIKLGWRGEPLMNKNAPTMISYAKERGIPEVLLNTNATLLTAERSLQIIESGLDMLIISLDSMSKAAYEEIRRGADFVAVLSNILTFVKLRDAHRAQTGSPKPLVRVQMVIMDDNEHERDFFVQFFSQVVDLIATKDYNNRGEKEERLSRDLKPNGRRPCPQLWQRTVVTHDGTVAMCCRDWDLYHPLGRIEYPHSTIKYFWNSELMNQVRTLHSRGALDEVPGCKNCTFDESYSWS